MEEIIREIVNKHTDKLDGLIKKAMKDRGFIIGENMSLEELSKRGIITSFEKLNTLKIDEEIICCWTESTHYTVTEDNSIKVITEFKFSK